MEKALRTLRAELAHISERVDSLLLSAAEREVTTMKQSGLFLENNCDGFQTWRLQRAQRLEEQSASELLRLLN